MPPSEEGPKRILGDVLEGFHAGDSVMVAVVEVLCVHVVLSVVSTPTSETGSGVLRVSCTLD